MGTIRIVRGGFDVVGGVEIENRSSRAVVLEVVTIEADTPEIQMIDFAIMVPAENDYGDIGSRCSPSWPPPTYRTHPPRGYVLADGETVWAIFGLEVWGLDREEVDRVRVTSRSDNDGEPMVAEAPYTFGSSRFTCRVP